MSDNIFDDSRDEPLTRALKDATPPPPVDDVDWTALHARIRAAAQPTLAATAAAHAVAAARDGESARLAPRQLETVWQPLAGWSPFGIPLAAAATVLLMIGTALAGTRQVTESTTAGTTSFRTLEEEFVGGLGAGAAPILAGIGGDDMLDAVLFHDGEEW